MISTKKKRKLVYNGSVFYWYIDLPYLIVVPEDKKLRLQCGFDKEIGIGSQYFKKQLANHFAENPN